MDKQGGRIFVLYSYRDCLMFQYVWVCAICEIKKLKERQKLKLQDSLVIFDNSLVIGYHDIN